MENLMKQCSRSLSSASIDVNELSSPSHAVFFIMLTKVRIVQKLGPDLSACSQPLSYINLVNLVGSEKLPRLCSGAVIGQRAQEESRCINRGLSKLNEVIRCLFKSSFVSCRNSGPTWLLK